MQEPVDPGSGRLAVRARTPADHRLGCRTLHSAARDRRSQHRGPQRRARFRRDRGAAGRDRHLHRAAGGARARALPQRHGCRDPGLGPRGRLAPRRSRYGVLFLSDYAGLGRSARARALEAVRRHDLPSGGRDRRDRGGDRRVLRRRARRDLELGPRRRLEVGSPRPRHRGRTAANLDQLAARRPLDRHADQDRTVRPLPGGIRAQRRQPAGGARRAFAGRLLRGGDRGGPHRDQVHDPGDRAVRHLHRQRGGAVADPRRRQDRAVPGRVPHRPGRLRALHAQQRDPGAALGQAGYTRDGASRRRTGEGA